MTQRTTVALDADVLAAVKVLARQRHSSVGQAMSDLLRESLTRTSPTPSATSKNHLYIPARPTGAVVTTSDVQHIQDLIDDGEARQ